MPDDRHRSLSIVRLEKAKVCLSAAEELIAQGYCADSTNRLYYCIFHAMRVVLALDSFDSKKHSGVIAAFRQKYIKTRVLSKTFSKIIDDAFKVRGKCDYDDFYIVSKQDAEEQITNAKTFLAAVESYIHTRI
jgi:uncharacterized protein (UPF0332 family)